MKILLVGWNRLGKRPKGNWNHELFRRELARQQDVKFFGVGYEGYDKKLTIQNLLKIYPDIDMILTHYEFRENALISGLEGVKNILKVHICGGDYNEKTFVRYNNHLNKVKYDIIFPRYSSQMRDLKYNDIEGEYYLLPWSVDINKHRNFFIEKTTDVMASFQISHKAKRRRILKQIISNMDINSFMENVWFEEYVRKINESKIFVTYNPEDGELSGKYTEVMACGILLMTNKPEGLEELGYKPGHHLIIYKDDFSDLEDKIKYFLKNESEREEIAKNGMDFVREKHSSEVRVKEFIEIMMRYL